MTRRGRISKKEKRNGISTLAISLTMSRKAMKYRSDEKKFLPAGKATGSAVLHCQPPLRSDMLPIVQPSPAVPDNQFRKTALEQLVALIINQDHVAQGFLKFLITLQGGLAVALSYFLTLPLRAQFGTADAQPRILFVVVPIAIFGAASTIALTAMAIHERKWQAWYIHCANELGANPPALSCGELAEPQHSFPKD